MQNRTDLALELKEEKNLGSAQSGVIVKTRIDTANHIKETKIIIKNKRGERALGKPTGNYITIEAKDLSANDGSFHKEMSEALFLNLKEMLDKKQKLSLQTKNPHSLHGRTETKSIINIRCGRKRLSFLLSSNLFFRFLII